MSETPSEQTNFQAAVEDRKAESRANLAKVIWTGLRLGANVLTLKIIWGRFLEQGGTQEELMSRQPEDFNSPPESSQTPKS